ncbi:MAG: metal-dependent hydrolase [Bdellovibrionales bacterium]|nr:metal-dependent hydrolase [Bdellovibrionales bacterium]
MNDKITYIGHSTIFVEAANSVTVAVDPWLEGNPLCPNELKRPEGISVIALTHGHSDHASSAASLAKANQSTVCAIWELAMLMKKEGVADSKLQPMNKGGTVEIPGSGGLKVSLTNAFHSSSFDASDGNTYYAGEACGVVLELPSGKTIYHAGDTCLFTDMEYIGRTFRPDVALLPIGDRFTMGPKQAADAVRLIKPRAVIPIHHSTFDLLSGTPEQFKQVLAGEDVECIVLAPGESFSL